jgi:hypothetical protein
MDDAGNARFGVRLPYHYWSREQWQQAWRELGMRAAAVNEDLGLYGWPVDLVFGRGLHFVAVLEPERGERAHPSNCGQGGAPD